MKNFFFTLVAILITNLSFAQIINLQSDSEDIILTSNTEKEMTAFLGIPKLEAIQINTDQGVFTKLILKDFTHSKEYGKPELPQMQKIIEIPIGAQITTSLISFEEQELELNQYGIANKILPAQPSISKGENASDAQFYYFPELYQLNEFLGKDLVTVEPLGIMRGVQIARLTISPFKYNPKENKLLLINNIEFKITYGNANYQLTENIKSKQYSPAFNKSFNEIFNYKPIPKDVITTYPVKYVIVSDPMFQNDLQNFIQWKTKKGFTVIEAYTNDPAVGNSTSSIKTYLEGLYNSATPSNPAPSYVLFVGDVAQIPSFSGNTGSHVSDLYYCTYDGAADIYPDIYYGRFSANNTAQLIPQIEKTLMFEEYTFPDPSYLDEVVLVAGVDASMAPTYGNGQINYGTDNYFNNAHGFASPHVYLYGSGSPITSDQSIASSSILNDVSEGVGFANYTAHCFEQGWADPAFENSDISGLSNTDKYCVIVSNCCLPNAFDNQACFGEAVVRANGKGAVGHIGASNNTYWNEDYWWAVGSGSISANPTYSQTGLGIFDCLFHDNGEPVSDWFTTLSQIVHSGNLAVTAAGGDEEYYWEIYHVMGDPSLMPYMSVPDQMSVTHLSSIPVGSSTLSVTAEEHAYVAVSQNGVLLDAQLVGSSGNALLTFNALSSMGTLDVVVTKQDKEPYIGLVQVISTNSPFVTALAYQIDDSNSNNNQQADYNEQFYLDVDFENLGSVTANGVTATLTSNDPNVTIIDDFENLNTFPSGSMNIPSAYELMVADGIQDQHVINMDVVIADNSNNTWTTPINIIANAPKLMIGNLELIDASGNGVLEPGETATVNIDCFNDGSSDCPNANATISCQNIFISIISSTHSFTNLASGGVIQQSSFTIEADPNIPYGTPITLDLLLSSASGAYNSNESFNIIANIASEDYESGNFLQYDWSVSGNVPWLIAPIGQYEGDFCAKSGPIGNNQSSVMELEVDVAVGGSFSFFKKVSSEDGYDFLEFYIDGNLRDNWSGLVDWSQETYYLTPGTHILRWEYVKDQWVGENADCAWVDYILLPQLVSTSTSTENFDDTNMNIFPNPNNGQCLINFNKQISGDIAIYDLKGKEVFNETINGNTKKLNLKQISSGLYYLQVETNDNIYVEKLIVY